MNDNNSEATFPERLRVRVPSVHNLKILIHQVLFCCCHVRRRDGGLLFCVFAGKKDQSEESKKGMA